MGRFARRLDRQWQKDELEYSWKRKTKEHLKNAGFKIIQIDDVVDPTANNKSTKPFYLLRNQEKQ